MKRRFMFIAFFFLIVSISLFAQDTEGFESGDFSAYEWHLSGNANWFVTTTAPHTGTYCAQGGDIDDNQETTISITKEVSENSNISFYWKVDSETNYDYLKFYIDENEIASISGTQDWALFETSVSMGTHTFKWSYTKDVSVSNGEDTGWIDDITFPLSITYDNDMAITEFSAPDYINVGEQLTASCTVKNSGNLPQNAFTLYLKTTNNEVLDSLDVDQDFQPGDSQSFDLIWDIPDSYAPGNVQIYAEVVLDNDENTNNNTSNPVTVHLLPQGLMIFDVGNGTETSNRVPIDFFYKSSISEVIYYNDELNMPGMIYSIKYYYSFNEDLTNQPINIWMGETSQTGLDQGWISAPQLQQVFSGNLNFSQGEGSVLITLDTPFQYTAENNLVILVERPLDSVYYSSQDVFYCTNVGEHTNRCRSYYSDSSPLDPQNLDNGAGDIRSIFPNITFSVMVGGLGDIIGVVHDEDNQPLENVLLTLVQAGRTTYSAADGSFSFSNINPGTYTITGALDGYNPVQVENIEVVGDSTTTVDMVMVPLATSSISGHVVGSDAPDVPLEGAQVTLEGFATYQTVTDANGDFIIADVYTNQNYHITISYAGYENYTADIDFGSDPLDLGTITLNEIAYPPANVMATQNDEQTVATVMWSNSGSFSGEYRYDDGTMVGQIGSASTPPRAAFGSKFVGSAILNEIRWYLTSEYASHNTVKIYVFSLDVTYNPTSNIVFESGTITNTDNEWNSYVFENPLQVDYGFMIAISTPNVYTGLGYDDGVGAPWEFVANTQYATDDYLTGNWTPIETYGFYNNLMLRAYGSSIGLKTKKNDRSLESYKIYRFDTANQNNPDLWDVIAENISIQDTMYVDSTYVSLPIGSYRYAVSAVYTNNVESQPTISNVLVKTTVDNSPDEIVPTVTEISQNYPNPFVTSPKKSSVTYFDVSVKENDSAELNIYNLKGQHIRKFKNIKSGKHRITWDGKDKNGKAVSSGVYFYKLNSKTTAKIGKMVLIKQ